MISQKIHEHSGYNQLKGVANASPSESSLARMPADLLSLSTFSASGLYWQRESTMHPSMYILWYNLIPPCNYAKIGQYWIQHIPSCLNKGHVAMLLPDLDPENRTASSAASPPAFPAAWTHVWANAGSSLRIDLQMSLKSSAILLRCIALILTHGIMLS